MQPLPRMSFCMLPRMSLRVTQSKRNPSRALGTLLRFDDELIDDPFDPGDTLGHAHGGIPLMRLDHGAAEGDFAALTSHVDLAWGSEPAHGQFGVHLLSEFDIDIVVGRHGRNRFVKEQTGKA